MRPSAKSLRDGFQASQFRKGTASDCVPLNWNVSTVIAERYAGLWFLKAMTFSSAPVLRPALSVSRYEPA